MQSINQIISNTQSKTAEKTTPIFNVGKTSQKRLKTHGTVNAPLIPNQQIQ